MLEVEAENDLRPLVVLPDLDDPMLLHRQQKLGELLVRGLLHVQLQIQGTASTKISVRLTYNL